MKPINIDGHIIRDEFDLFCNIYCIEGALRATLKREYLESGNLDTVEAKAREMGVEAILNEDAEHLLDVIKVRDVLAEIGVRVETRIRAAHNANSMKRRLFHIGFEREGD